ncbi:MAG TPA: PAS domain-containing sensor histidine kinase [Beijerinckia sp.]|nr:PAS domain-containing sensor histidine kinase [Beijerinckia sp.]
MGHFRSLQDQIANLVYKDVLNCEVEKARHQGFMLRRLFSSLGALLAAPFYLAFHGAPTLAEALTFAALIMPLGAVALLSVTGKLLLAEVFCTASLVAANVMIAATGASYQAGLTWLVLAPLEGIFSFDLIMVCVSGLLGAATILGLAGAQALGLIDPAPATQSDGFFAVSAIVYATLAAVGFVRSELQRQQAEQRNASRYQVLAETVGDLVVTYDRTGAVRSVSRNCEILLGLPPGELMGRGFFELVHVADRPAFLKAVADAGSGSEPVNAVLRLRSAEVLNRGQFSEPTFLWLDMRARRAEPMAADTIVAIFRDITKAKFREEELESARKAAEAASRSKDHFLANMSHELRTPLNAIIGFSEILGDPQLCPREAEKQREYARVIHGSGQHLLAVVNSILDMSKIQAGSFELLPEPLAVAPLISLCCDMVKLEAAEKGVVLIRAYPEKLEEIIGDQHACKQILINLLSNAVKFTPAMGRVSVGARPEGNSLVITVTDTGIGINASDLVRLGDPFFQAKAARDRPYEGTGLGLSIVRGLVGLHGGSIMVESEPGKGTCVTVRLPQDCRGFMEGPRPLVKIETISRRSFFREAQDVSKDIFQPGAQAGAQYISQDMMVKNIA